MKIPLVVAWTGAWTVIHLLMPALGLLLGTPSFAGDCIAGEAHVIVENGQSDYVIALPLNATQDAAMAASELQRVVQQATGVRLPISREQVESPAIRILHDDRLPADGFEIKCKDRDLIIAGNDLQSASVPTRWFMPSHGSYFGTLEFLERFVGARWLMPGLIGEDIPQTSHLSVVLQEPILGQPSFQYRVLMYVGEDAKEMPAPLRQSVIEWMTRNRVTNARHQHLIEYGHSWDDYLQPSDIEAHPDWASSAGPAIKNGRVKYVCTTAPGLVQTFAQRLIQRMDRNLPDWGAPISPTDGGDFCRCSRCEALLTQDPHGKVNHSLAILTFYRQVAEIVMQQRPDRRLGGFAYYNYQYPPPSAPEMPDNFSLSWTPLNYYGYGLYKPVYRDEFSVIMNQWSKVSTHLCYHNYSTWMRSFHGAPLPIGLDILNLELPTAAKHGAWGASMTGTSAWGINAPINYLLAKQMWDANINVSQTLDDWLARAYGPGWQSMREIYDELDVRMKRHKEAQSPIYKGSQYEVNEEVMKTIYAPMFPSIERCFREAFSLSATEAQRMRLRMFANNLIQLHYALRRASLIPAARESIFYRDDQAFEMFLVAMKGDLSLYRDSRGIDHGPIWKGEWQAP